MKCEIDKEKLHLFSDNQLSEAEEITLNQHVLNCNYCTAELQYLKQLRKDFSKMEPVKISPQLLSLLNQIDKPKRKFFLLLTDIIKIIFRNETGIFHIDAIAEMTLHGKYSERIIRWVFYC